MEDHALNLAKTLLSFREHSLFCDTAIVTKNRLIFAHSAILAATCPVMFSLLNQQPFNNQKTNIIQLEKFDSELVEELLGFFYTGEVNTSRASEFREICHLLGVTLSFSSSETVGTGCDLLEQKISQEARDVAKSDSEINTNVLSGNIEAESRQLPIIRKQNSDGHFTSALKETLAQRYKKSDKINHSSTNLTNVSRTEVKKDGAISESPCKGFQNFPSENLNEQQRNNFTQKEVPQNESKILAESLMESLQSNLLNAATKITKLINYPCSLCEASFSTQRSLNVHKYSHNIMDDGKYQCHLCSKIFEVRDYLRKHVRGHYSVKVTKQARNYFCEVCKKKFRTPARLESHANMHARKKPFVCVICGKSYSDKEYLVKHQRLHRNEKPYLCDDCGLRFSFRQSYTSHCRIHTVEKPYVCSDCKRAFAQVSALHSHLKVHAHPSSLTCTTCQKRFPSARRLALHTVAVHAEGDVKRRSDYDTCYAKKHLLD